MDDDLCRRCGEVRRLHTEHGECRGVYFAMCAEPGCVLAADHPPGEHRQHRVSLLACPHNVPNFGPSCPICD